MKKLPKLLLAGLLAIPTILLTACGAMDVKGKTYEYESSTVTFSGSGTANQTELENEKQRVKSDYENATLTFNEDGTVTVTDDTLYYTQDGSEIMLYADNEKKNAFDGFDGSNVKICVKNNTLVITYDGDEEHDNSNYSYRITLKQRNSMNNNNDNADDEGESNNNSTNQD